MGLPFSTDENDVVSKFNDKSDTKEELEEVIAEDYDDHTDSQDPFSRNDKRIKSSDEISDDVSSEGSYKKFKVG